MKKILHINSDYLYTDIYKLMFKELKFGTKNQTVYSALRKSEINYSAPSDHFSAILSPILNKSDSLFFNKRINKSYNNLKLETDCENFDLVHAHFLFTDGAVALRIFEEYKIPYIVAIRNTDLNLYYKYFFHLRKLGQKILLNAEKIIVISPSYKDKITEYLSSEKNILNSKLVLIPNGIDDFWLMNKSIPKINPKTNELKFLFVGEITKNKNLKQTINLLEQLSKYYNIKFTIIGKKLDGYAQLSELAKKYSWIDIFEPIYNKIELKRIYRDHDIFIMLSKKETFGLVYIEALTQGTPIIYTKNEGVDGYFSDSHVGYNFDIKINNFFYFKEKVELIMKNYNQISSNCILDSKKFNWKQIAKRYLAIYNSI